MIRGLILIGCIYSELAGAYALGAVANHVIKCGEHTVRFGPDALIATLDGRRTDVRWDDEGMSAEIGEFRLELDQLGAFQMADQVCVFAP